jgi:hypothetical protein
MAPDQHPTTSPDISRISQFGKWWLVVAVVALCAIPFFRSYELRERPIEEDEIYWIGQTYYYHLAFESCTWSDPDWQLLPARENPVLGKYLLGLGLKLNGLSVTNLDWLGVYYHIGRKSWGEGHDREERQAVMDRMQASVRDAAVNEDRFEYPPAYLICSRSIMAVFGVLSVVTVFFLTSLYTSRIAAFLAAVLFSLHPAVVAAYTEVGVDILAIAFSSLTVLHFVLIQRAVWRGCARPRLWRALICGTGGLSLALAVGSKLNAAVVGFLGTWLCLAAAVTFVRRRSETAKEQFVALATVLLLAFFLFVVSNPLDYPNPVRGLWAAYVDQQHSLELQKARLPIPPPPQNWGERFHALAILTAFDPVGFALIAGIFALQVVLAIRQRVSPSIVDFWWLIAVVLVSLWLPFVRVRYVLPVVAPSIILVSIAGDCLVKLLQRRRRTDR